jgi:hypothetical protein
MFEFNYLLVWLGKKNYKLLDFYAQDIIVIFINNIIQSLFNLKSNTQNIVCMGKMYKTKSLYDLK